MKNRLTLEQLEAKSPAELTAGIKVLQAKKEAATSAADKKLWDEYINEVQSVKNKKTGLYKKLTDFEMSGNQVDKEAEDAEIVNEVEAETDIEEVEFVNEEEANKEVEKEETFVFYPGRRCAVRGLLVAVALATALGGVSLFKTFINDGKIATNKTAIESMEGELNESIIPQINENTDDIEYIAEHEGINLDEVDDTNRLQPIDVFDDNDTTKDADKTVDTSSNTTTTTDTSSTSDTSTDSSTSTETTTEAEVIDVDYAVENAAEVAEEHGFEDEEAVIDMAALYNERLESVENEDLDTGFTTSAQASDDAESIGTSQYDEDIVPGVTNEDIENLIADQDEKDSYKKSEIVAIHYSDGTIGYGFSEKVDIPARSGYGTAVYDASTGETLFISDSEMDFSSGIVNVAGSNSSVKEFKENLHNIDLSSPGIDGFQSFNNQLNSFIASEQNKVAPEQAQEVLRSYMDYMASSFTSGELEDLADTMMDHGYAMRR